MVEIEKNDENSEELPEGVEDESGVDSPADSERGAGANAQSSSRASSRASSRSGAQSSSRSGSQPSSQRASRPASRAEDGEGDFEEHEVDGDDRVGDDRVGDELPRAVRQRLEAFVPELVKRTFAAGMGAVFSTEEGIRRVAKDITLPKEVAGYIANTAGATKDEVVRIIAREVREFLEGVNISEEIAKILTMLSFEIKTEIRFIPNDEKLGGVSPDVKAKVRLKKSEETGRRRRRRFRTRRPDASDDQLETDPDTDGN